ncbi:hypothetical protein BH20ACT5_BH20ACT5_08940 [soil metagenome]
MTDQVPAAGALADFGTDVDALLLVSPRRRSPRTVINGPTVTVAGGRRVPVGVLPAAGPGLLAGFAAAAARVHDRRAGDGASSIAVLAQRSRRYLHLAARIRRLVDRQDGVLWWPADEMIRADLVQGLGLGLATTIYVGHGRPTGWAGYAGLRAHHLSGAAQPCGIVLSLACHTASRRRTGLSFTESLVLRGSAAAALGAATSTPHVANARWSLRITAALSAGVGTAGELVAAAEPDGELSGRYRLIGDPMAPLLDAPGARAAARALTEDVALEVVS